MFVFGLIVVEGIRPFLVGGSTSEWLSGIRIG
jgi:hypothetical protein